MLKLVFQPFYQSFLRMLWYPTFFCLTIIWHLRRWYAFLVSKFKVLFWVPLCISISWLRFRALFMFTALCFGHCYQSSTINVLVGWKILLWLQLSFLVSFKVRFSAKTYSWCPFRFLCYFSCSCNRFPNAGQFNTTKWICLTSISSIFFISLFNIRTWICRQKNCTFICISGK